MSAGDSSIFRKAALERLASPERLDVRPSVPSYPAWLAVALFALAIAVITFTVWLR